ncbi:MAG: hypothetical protein AB7U73_20560, partial [Pirellulales bacterium]
PVLSPELVALKSHTWTDDPRDADTLSFQPTDAMPGTEEKLQVLIKRLDAGLPLWHPSDRRHLPELPEPQRESA